MMLMPDASSALTFAFAAFGVFVAAGFVWLVGRAQRTLGPGERRYGNIAAIVGLWLTVTLSAAATGLLARTDLKPAPMMLLFGSLLVAGAAIGFGGVGRTLAQGLPLWLLILSQGFRLPLELLMHQAAVEGVMPVQMSYSGRNFDIVTGITALVVAWLVWSGRAGHRLATAWNVVGSVLLMNIMAVAVLSTPLFARFGPDQLNTWVAFPPFVWLPAVMVPAALIAHIVIARKLRTLS
jgi:hypothetical protein